MDEENTIVDAEQCFMKITPGGSKYWVPNCEVKYKPCVGRRFRTLDEGVQFYRYYAGVSGFDVRQSTSKRDVDGKVTTKYLVCSREGYKGDNVSKVKLGVVDNGVGVKLRRKRSSNRVGCAAKIGFRMVVSRDYVISIFEEKHNHCLCSGRAKMFMRANRKLNVGQQVFMASCAKVNIGPAQTFKLYTEVVGGVENVGATNVEFRNFKRDLQVYLEGGDAQMIIDKLRKKKELCDEFFFSFHLDDDNRLSRIFWADPIARRNFTHFGDVVSFDATYGTNRYNLVFVPFTGVDNHKRCVTFAAGLLTKEDVDSYTWVLENFQKSMGRAPLYFVTDEDPALKIAVPRVFVHSRHQFCMWHIMTKVSEKVGNELAKNEDFRGKLNMLVWNEGISVESFEVQWRSLMEEYNLVDHRWFEQLFEQRQNWIPAYFADMFMGGLFRTTSRSEGENSAYGKFTYPHASLVEFYMSFESVLDAQRYHQSKRDAKCEGYLPELKTPLELEAHAAATYTITVFYEVQKEIIAGCFYCRVVGLREVGGYTVYDIKGGNNLIFTVRHIPADNTTVCTCGLFQLLGLVCRHMFLVFKDAQIRCIPPQYVVPRWTRQPCNDLNVPNRTNGNIDSTIMLDPQSMCKELWPEIYACIGLVGNNTERWARMAQVLKELKEELTVDCGGQEHVKGNKSVIRAMCGVDAPDNITIKPPVKARNKGSGKRIKGNRELGIEHSAKPKRLCRSCKQFARHDSRNCPGL